MAVAVELVEPTIPVPKPVSESAPTEPAEKPAKIRTRPELDDTFFLIHYAPAIPLKTKHGVRRWWHQKTVYREIPLDVLERGDSSATFRQIEALMRALPHRGR